MAGVKTLSLTNDDFHQMVIESPLPVLVDFWGEGCGPCKMIAPVLDELAVEYNGKATIGKVNIDEARELAMQFGVRALPTLIIFKNGQIIQQMVGMRSKKELKTSLENAIA